MKDSFVELVALIMLFLSLSFAYYAAFLKPRNQALYEIMDCMGSDASEEAFEECRKELRDKRLADRAPPG